MRLTESQWTRLTTGLLLVYVCSGVMLVNHYGITFDESVHSKNGENVLAWYTSAFTDRSFMQFSNLRYYGVLFDLPPVAIERATGADLWLVRHVYAFGFAVLTVAGIASLARGLNGPAAGFWAALALILTPRFFGHGFNNGKDIPLAACTVWTVAAAVRFVQSLPHPRRVDILSLGVWWGLALAVRINALLILTVIATAFAAWWWTGERRGSVWSTVKRLVPSACTVAVIAAIVMLPFWPYLQVRAVLGLARVVREQWRAAGFGSLPVLYNGEVINYLDVPATYVWAWLFRITPEFYFVGIAMAIVASLRSRPWSPNAIIGWITVIAAVAIPLGLATLTRPALYDGLRHFLFATVFLAIPVGAGVAWCVRGTGLWLVRTAGLVLFAASAALTLADMIRIHPYQSTFFNRSVAGGLVGAAGRWDTDYWGNALREATLWLVDNVPPATPRPRVAGSATAPQTQHYVPSDRFDYIGSVDDLPFRTNPYANPPDFYIGLTRWDHDRFYPGEVIHRVARDGVTLAVVVKVDRQAASRLTPADRPPPK